MRDERHLYLILHPNHSLIASQLGPEQFLRHYVQGSTRYFEGRLIFVEVDPDFRHEYFDIDKAYSELIPHEDGRPKATKFIKSYRTLEHMDFAALGKLYLGNSVGDYVELESAEYDPNKDHEEFRIMLEINPVKFIVLTRYNFKDFGSYIANPENSKGAPKSFFSELEFSTEEFLKEYEENPLIRCYVPGIHPARLRNAILEVKQTPGKQVKGISLDCPVDRISYKHLRDGFMFASPGGYKYYPLLSLDDVERRFYRYWKTM
ncbi:MAG: hypothetical protein RBT73_02720 [Spirochaetia bacterium]|jgi:hypothetical protein|nr:hypothetical protein [Spirochaetia bacterium]